MPTPKTPTMPTKTYLMESESGELNSIRLLKMSTAHTTPQKVVEIITDLNPDDFNDVLTQKSGNGNMIHHLLFNCSIDIIRPLLQKITTLTPTQQKNVLALLTQPTASITPHGANALVVASLHNQAAVTILLDIISQLNDPDFTIRQLTQTTSNGTHSLFLTLSSPPQNSQPITSDAFDATLKIVQTLPPEDQKIIFSQITVKKREILSKAVLEHTPTTINKLLNSIMQLPLQYILEIDSVINLTKLHALLLEELSKKEHLIAELVDLYVSNEPLRDAKKTVITPPITLRPHIGQILNDIIYTQRDDRHQKDALIALTLIRQAESLPAADKRPDEPHTAAPTMESLLPSQFREYQDINQSINNPTHLLYWLFTQLKNDPGNLSESLIKLALNRESEKNKPEALLALALIAHIEGKGPEAQDYLQKLQKPSWIPRLFQDPIPQALLTCTPLKKKLTNPRTDAINLFINTFRADIEALLLSKPTHLDEDKPSMPAGGIN